MSRGGRLISTRRRNAACRRGDIIEMEPLRVANASTGNRRRRRRRRRHPGAESAFRGVWSPCRRTCLCQGDRRSLELAAARHDHANKSPATRRAAENCSGPGRRTGPLDFDGRPALEAVDRMGWAGKPPIIDRDRGRKVLFNPTPLFERTIEPPRDRRAVSAFRLGAVQRELARLRQCRPIRWGKPS